MNRIDLVIVRRLAGSIGLTITIMFGLVALLESMNTARYAGLDAIGGPLLAVGGIVLSTVRWLLNTLPLTVLIGAILGLLDLQATRELTVIKASGHSVWRLLVGPILLAGIGGLLVTVVVDTTTIQLTRALTPTAAPAAAGSGGRLWLDQKAGGLHYILEAGFAHPGGERMDQVTVFMLDQPRERIEAPSAELMRGEWRLNDAVRFRSNGRPQVMAEYRLPTTSTPGDMQARLSSVRNLTVFELAASLGSNLTDPELLSETATRFLSLIGLPLTLIGSVVIAFAFTAGYRRTNKYSGAVLYGVVLGLVVFVVTEMAARAGDAGAIQPALAAFGPPFVAILVGVTLLLFREDGRT